MFLGTLSLVLRSTRLMADQVTILTQGALSNMKAADTTYDR
jgi:hypothetical protein